MNRAKVLETILVLVLALVVIYWRYPKNTGLLLAAVIIGLVGLFVPSLAEKIHWLWMRLAEGIGYVMSKVTLTIVFIFLLVPIAFAARLFRRNPSIKIERNKSTYFKERNFTYDKESLKNIW